MLDLGLKRLIADPSTWTKDTAQKGYHMSGAATPPLDLGPQPWTRVMNYRTISAIVNLH